MSLTISLTPGYTFQDGDELTPAILRLIAQPNIQLQGSISSASIPDGGVTTAKLAPGALSANTAGRNIVANGFITLVMLGSAIFTADASGRVPFAAGFINTSLLADANVTAAKLDESAAKGIYQYAADTGSASAYAVALTPAPTTYTEGMIVRFKAVNANTAAPTLNVNTLGAKNLKKGSLALIAGNIAAGAIVEAVYDGTNFQVVSVLRGWDFVGTVAVPAASAVATVAHGLGAIPTRWRVVLLQNTLATQQGYSQNDEVDLAAVEAGTSGEPAVAPSADGTNITIARHSNANVDVIPKTGGGATNITTANWLLKVYASL